MSTEKTKRPTWHGSYLQIIDSQSAIFIYINWPEFYFKELMIGCQWLDFNFQDELAKEITLSVTRAFWLSGKYFICPLYAFILFLSSLVWDFEKFHLNSLEKNMISRSLPMPFVSGVSLVTWGLSETRTLALITCTVLGSSVGTFLVECKDLFKLWEPMIITW